MKLFPDKILIAVIFLIILAISAVVFVYYRQSAKTQQITASVLQTNEVLYHSAKLLAAVEENVIRARNFGLTGNTPDLEQKSRSEKETYNQLEYLRRLTLKNGSQQKRIDSLSENIDKRVSYSNRIINIRQNYGRDSAIKFI